MPKRMDTDDARQGRKGTPVLIILIAGLALCVLVFIGLGVYGWMMPDSDIETPVTSDAGSERTAPADTGAVTQQPAGQAAQ